MKRILFLFVLLALSWQGMAQIPIGNGSTKNASVPIEPYYGYSYTQSIYLQSEISGSGSITELTWDFAGTSLSNSDEWTIYIGHTTKTEFADSNDWVDISTLTQVFSGLVTINADNKVVVDIADFLYNNTDNLVIAVDENKAGYNSGTDDFKCFITTTNRSINYYSDTTNPEPGSPPEAKHVYPVAPNIILGGIATTLTPPECATNPTPMVGATVDLAGTGEVVLAWSPSVTGDPATSYNILWGSETDSLEDIGAIGDTSVSITGLLDGEPYFWTIVPSNAGGAPTGCPEWNFMTTGLSSYCLPAPTSADGDGMTNVTFGTINNTSTLPTEAPFYSDFTTMVTDVIAGGTENISITFETGYSYDTWVWVDWNNDFDFNDDNEAMYLGSSSADNPTTENWTFSIPASASAGSYRMRIGAADGLGTTSADPCYTGPFGEFEDYTITVTVPDCFPPSNIVATISPTSILLNWDGNGAISWDIEYGPAGFTQGSGTSANATVDSFALTSLTPETSYDFYLMSNCGTTASVWIGPLVFSTPPTPPTNDLCASPIPLTLDVNECGANTITGISNFGTTDSGEPAPTCGAYTATADYGDLWYSITIPTGVSEVTFDVSIIDGISSVAGAIYSGSCGDLTELSCTQFMSGWPWDITDLVAGETYLLRVWDYGNNDSGTFDLCGFYITCPPPSVINTSNITTTTADITWAADGATDWEIVVQSAGTGEPTTAGTAVTGTANYEVLDLTSNTSYEVYIRTNCGSTLSSWAGPINFTTNCFTIVPDYFEDFSTMTGALAPDCWKEGNGNLDQGPTYGPSGWFADDYLNDATAENLSARFNLYNNTDSAWLVSPTLDLSAGGYQLKFDFGLTKYLNSDASDMGSDDEVRLLISEDNGATWATLETWNVNNTPSNTGEAFQQVLTTTSETVKFAFWAYEGVIDNAEDYNIYFDNFEVKGCAIPTNLVTSDITSTGFTVTLDSDASANKWQVVPAGNGMNNGIVVEGEVDANTIVVTGLEPSTSYDFYVQAKCGELYSGAASLMNIGTLVGMNELTNINGLLIYPNPVKDILNIDIDGAKATSLDIEVVDMFGKTLLHQSANLSTGQFKTNLDVSKLAAGTYFVKITDENNSAGFRFVKE